jgi:chemotaxis protein MotB
MSERRSRHSRRKLEDERSRHEAWAISYSDLLTLLLAFFVVMYAVSSVNAGKYRVLSDSLNAAFRGAPKSPEPVQVGEKQRGDGADIKMSIVQQGIVAGQPRDLLQDIPTRPPIDPSASVTAAEQAALHDAPAALEKMQGLVEQALAPLISQDLVTVRRTGRAVEVEIRTDLLFGSGSATLAPAAIEAIRQLARALRDYTNPVRVEGHTDNVPISTAAFPSNWELSAARAASVVHVIATEGVDPALLAVLGFGEFRPVKPNTTAEGRNANRRVLIVILGAEAASAASSGLPPGKRR